MSCKSAIQVVNTTVGTAIANGGIYVPNQIVRRFGQSVNLGANGVVIGTGCTGVTYYDVEVVATVTATAVGNVTATLYQDGAAVPGATATVTATAIGDEVVLPISTLVKVVGFCGSNATSTLTVVISDQATTSDNLSFKVTKD